MKMTLAIALRGDCLKECLKEVALVYGSVHLVYVENSKGKMVCRG